MSRTPSRNSSSPPRRPPPPCRARARRRSARSPPSARRGSPPAAPASSVPDPASRSTSAAPSKPPPTTLVYVGGENRIQSFDSDGNHTGEIAFGGAPAPEPGTVGSLAVDQASGDIYFAYESDIGIAQVTGAAIQPDVHRLDPADGEVTDTLAVAIPTAIATAPGRQRLRLRPCRAERHLLPRQPHPAGAEVRHCRGPPPGRGAKQRAEPVRIRPVHGLRKRAGDRLGLLRGRRPRSLRDEHGGDRRCPRRVRPRLGRAARRPDRLPPPRGAAVDPRPVRGLRRRRHRHCAGEDRPPLLGGHRLLRAVRDRRLHRSEPGGLGRGMRAGGARRAGILLADEVVSGEIETPDVVLSGLEPDTEYRYRFVAQSGGGGPVFGEGGTEEVDGEVNGFPTFATDEPPPPVPPCKNQSLREGTPSAAPARVPRLRAGLPGGQERRRRDPGAGDRLPRRRGGLLCLAKRLRRRAGGRLPQRLRRRARRRWVGRSTR